MGDMRPKPLRQLKILLMDAGMTQVELARKTGLHRNYLNTVINGWHIPNEQQKERIAEALGETVDSIFTTDGGHNA